jgi:NAD(P)-dependent dehydrogenase (short-subunit alcohol dehydrogenase family)
MPDLSGSTAIVTGGARGIGLAMARALAECGASIGLIDLLAEVSDSAATLTKETGVVAAGVIADVRDAKAVEAAVERLQQQLGTADLLITSAGITIWGDSTEGRHGSVIFVSSMSGRVVNIPQFQASYNSSKAAVSMLAKSLAVEWAPSGIRVNALEPGYTLSDMTRQFMDANPELAAQWTSLIPMGRMGEPADLVGALTYLASSESSYLTGQSIVIDGGYTAI